MDWALVGLAAGALTSSSFVPQIVKGWRTKRLADVSPWMLAVMFLGLSMWLAYGIARADAVLIAANALGVTLSGTLLGLWWLYRRAPRA